MLLSVKNLSKNFGQLAAINDLSFEINEGELKAIIGPNGAGKTTLFNALTGSFLPSEGQIFFQDKEITGAKPHKIAQMGIARSFQINNFFPNLSTYENIRISVQSCQKRRTSIWRNFGKEDSVDEKTKELMEWIGLSEYCDELAMNLSYGDQRKLEIALALGTNPLLLLLDEPTSGMSRYESGAMIDLIKKLSERVTIMLIEHDIEFVMKVSENILVIHYGQKIAEGKPVDIEQNEEVQRVYLGGL